MKKTNIVWSIIVLVIFIALIVLGSRWAKKHPVVPKETVESQLSKITEPVKQIMQEGSGDGAVLGDTVTVLYMGALGNGTVFDTNIAEVAKQAGLDKEGREYNPFAFKLGTTEVISGWNIGVTGMKKGEIAQVILPASYAYGAQGVPGIIPPNSPLVFQIQVVDIQKAPIEVAPVTDKTKVAPKAKK